MTVTFIYAYRVKPCGILKVKNASTKCLYCAICTLEGPTHGPLLVLLCCQHVHNKCVVSLHWLSVGYTTDVSLLARTFFLFTFTAASRLVLIPTYSVSSGANAVGAWIRPGTFIWCRNLRTCGRTPYLHWRLHGAVQNCLNVLVSKRSCSSQPKENLTFKLGTIFPSSCLPHRWQQAAVPGSSPAVPASVDRRTRRIDRTAFDKVKPKCSGKQLHGHAGIKPGPLVWETWD